VPGLRLVCWGVGVDCRDKTAIVDLGVVA
jgi:hypothetical protein